MALVAALLLLLVLTMLGVGMFRSFGLQEHIAGNTRERQRALHAAMAAQSYAEWWLQANSGNNAQQGNDCSSIGAVTPTATTPPAICTNAMSNPATLPWTNYVTYTPASQSSTMSVGAAGVTDNYIHETRYYINWVSSIWHPESNTITNNYLVDGNGYAGTDTTAAVVESALSVNVTHTAENDNTINANNGRK
jgi:type IV pilus assembly protein PilX